MTCVRRAWLELGTMTLDLEDADAGYYCTQLDLGWPNVREVVTTRPDRHGVFDRTQFFGSRGVSADIEVTDGVGLIDEIAASFAPFMIPDQRPVLHYVLDRTDAPERIINLRAQAYTWPIAGPTRRSVHLQWLAADPIAYSPIPHGAVSHAGNSVIDGRTYDLEFDREYPAGSGTGPTAATLTTDGDLPARPLFIVYGPIEDPIISLQNLDTAAFSYFAFDYMLDAGQRIEIDALNHTALFFDVGVVHVAGASGPEGGVNILSSVDWSVSTWPLIPPHGDGITMQLSGSGTDDISQVQAYWFDGFLT